MKNGDTRNSVIFNNKLLHLQNLMSAIAPPPTHTHTHIHTQVEHETIKVW